ncbi:MAG: TetR/AcrR family transcriptional regulator [Coriobacteriales bacterium]|jgi:AcrR family transcriptional regulator
MLERGNANAERSKREISWALLGLMQDGAPFEKITVTQIAKRSGYSRQTFYQHFSNKEDALLYLLEDRFDHYFEQMKRLPFTSREALVDAVCTIAMKVYWDTSVNFAEILVSNGLTVLLVEFLADAWREFFEHYREFFPMPQYSEREREYVYRHIAGGPLAMMYAWKSKEDTEEGEIELLLKKLIARTVL